MQQGNDPAAMAAKDVLSATLIPGGAVASTLTITGRYHAECFNPDGTLAWEEDIENVVTTVGRNLALDTVLSGSAYTASVVMGLKGTGTAVAADTMASHASWSEVGGSNAPAYTGNRPTPAFSAASAGAKATSAAVSFSFTSAGTVAGCFMTLAGSSTKDNTTGTLLSAGDFSGGNQVVNNGSTLNVTYSLTLT